VHYIARTLRAAVVLVAAAACLLSGCAQHAQVICRPLELVSSGDYEGAVASLDETSIADSSLDRFLYRVQRGHLLHLAGEYEASNHEFELAAAITEELEPFSLSETVTDYTLNEAARTYHGEDFERAYVHYYMALNYLAMDDLEEALVECRRVDQVFRELDARYEEETGRYQDDGFIRYLSGLVYEARGERDEAFIDYRKAVLAYEGETGAETGTGVPPGLLESFVCTGRRQGRDDDVAALVDSVDFPCESGTSAEIVVVIENGWAPYKREAALRVPIVRERVPREYWEHPGLEAVIKIAVPELESVPVSESGFSVVAADTALLPVEIASAERVQDVDALARWALARRLPALTARSAIRTTLKTVALIKAQDAREEDREKDGEDRGWLSRIFDFAVDYVAPVVVGETEQADTRGWITLPSEIWIARVPVRPGNYHLFVDREKSAGGADGRRSIGRVTVGPRETVFRSCRIIDRPHPIRCEEPPRGG
jgi:hypothetical protein